MLVEDYAEGVAWLQSLGATLTPLPSLPDRLVYLMEPTPRAFVRHMVDRFIAQGGTLLTQTAGVALITAVVLVAIATVLATRVGTDAALDLRRTAGIAALNQAWSEADPQDRIVVFGSFYTVGAVLRAGLPRPQAPHLG